MEEGIGVLIVLALIAGYFSISHIGPNEGQHTGYVTAIEQEGIIWKTWRAYIKTDPQSSQEDSYCVQDTQVIAKLKNAEKNRELITIEYSSPFIVFKWDCDGENSIIKSVEAKSKFPIWKTIEIGGKTARQLKSALEAGGFKFSLHLREDFDTKQEIEEITLVRLKVKDLGFTSIATTEQIYQKAQELGLELCPAEVGPYLRLVYTNQPLDEWLHVGMKQISDSGGNPRIFGLGRNDDGLWLRDRWAGPGSEWYPDVEFVFRLRK